MIDVKNLRKRSNLGIKGLIIVGKNELVAFFRNKGLVASQLLQPILYVVFIIVGLNQSVGEVIYRGHSISYAKYATIGVFALLIIGQMSQVIYRVTIDKRYGLLALKLSSGVKPIFYILGMSVYPALGLLTQEVVIYVVALLFDIRISLERFLSAIALSLIILLFWNSIGILITMFIHNYQTRDIIIRFLLTPLGFTAPVFYALESAPLFIQLFGKLNPLTYQLMIIRDAAFGSQNIYSVFSISILSLLAISISVLVMSKIELVLKER
jgi:ABC-2 type transport system permease protein